MTLADKIISNLEVRRAIGNTWTKWEPAINYGNTIAGYCADEVAENDADSGEIKDGGETYQFRKVN